MWFIARPYGNPEHDMAEARETRTIVVGYDGSDPARRGLSRVGGLLSHPTKLILVSVVPELDTETIRPEPLVGRDFDAERLLAEAAELVGERGGVTIERRAAAGDPAAVLVEATREVNAGPADRGPAGQRLRLAHAARVGRQARGPAGAVRRAGGGVSAPRRWTGPLPPQAARIILVLRGAQRCCAIRNNRISGGAACPTARQLQSPFS